MIRTIFVMTALALSLVAPNTAFALTEGCVVYQIGAGSKELIVAGNPANQASGGHIIFEVSSGSSNENFKICLVNTGGQCVDNNTFNIVVNKPKVVIVGLGQSLYAINQRANAFNANFCPLPQRTK